MVVVKSEKQKKIKSEPTKTKSGSKKIKDDDETVDKLTPYQGNRRCFGIFICTKCSRRWGSASSWANMGQECQKCRINVYPCAQWRLKKKRRSKVSEPGKGHISELCEKCKTIGHSCMVRIRSDEDD